jgi:hypothetical protein
MEWTNRDTELVAANVFRSYREHDPLCNVESPPFGESREGVIRLIAAILRFQHTSLLPAGCDPRVVTGSTKGVREALDAADDFAEVFGIDYEVVDWRQIAERLVALIEVDR